MMVSTVLEPGAAERTYERGPGGRIVPRVEPRPVRLTRRGRRLVRSLAVLTLVLLGVLGVFAGQAAVAGGAAPTSTVVVGPGESLWSIATRALPDDDARDAVVRVADLNGLDVNARLQVGQSLVVPTG